MNFHTDNEIMEQVNNHLNEAKKIFNETNIIGIFYHGSGNYGLDYESSDVDTKLAITPTLGDICKAKQPISTTKILKNNEHIDLKDIRLLIQNFEKQNLAFIEILFTKYKILNPDYKEIWEELEKNKELIARYNENATVATMKGIAMEKYHAMEHRYPSKIDVIEKYGYDAKQLHHLLRIDEFLKRYTSGEQYEDCLISNMPDYLIDIKRSKYNLDDARIIADRTIEEISIIADKFRSFPRETNFLAKGVLDSAKSKFIEKSLRMEINNE